MVPMARFMTIMTPKWMGSMPTLVTTGRQNHDPAVGQVQDQGADGLRKPGEGEHEGEYGGGTDDQHDDGGHDPGLRKNSGEILQGDAAVDKKGEKEGVDHGNTGGLCWGEVSGKDAADDDDNQKQRGDRVEHRVEDLFGGQLLSPLHDIAVLFCIEQRYGHAAGSPEKARDPSCHQQRSDAGAAGGCRVDDEGVGGRDELANRCGGDVGGSGETPVIAVLLFQGSEHAADGGCRGDAGSGEGAEQRVARNVGQGEGSGDFSHHQHCQVDDPLGDAAVGHQGACQDEERHRKEGEGVNSCDQLLGGDEHAEGRAQEHDDGDQRGGDDAEGDRHLQRQHQEEYDEKDNACLQFHGILPLFLVGPAQGAEASRNLGDAVQHHQATADRNADVVELHRDVQGWGDLSDGIFRDEDAA